MTWDRTALEPFDKGWTMRAQSWRLFGFGALMILGLAGGMARAQSRFAFFEPVQPRRAIQLMAHRGMATLAPENSLEAILACADDFVEWAEIDIRLSADGHHILIHDATLDRTTNGTGPVAARNLNELLTLDAGLPFARRFAGGRLATLPETLKACKNRVNLYLDCKAIEPELLVKEILAAGMERQVIVYGQIDTLRTIQKISQGKIPVMAKYRPGAISVADFVSWLQPQAVEIDADQIHPALCEAFHKLGITVQAKVLGPDWDRPAVWDKVIAAGVDWIQTDRPLALRFHEVRHRLGRFPVKIAFHRGASRYAPENTLAAITQAVDAGADFVEIDIRTTRDGKPVLLHDARLDRTTSGKGPVKEIGFRDCLALKAGAWFGRPYQDATVPDLDTALKALGTATGAYLDAKEVDPAVLIAAIDRHQLWERHVVYQSAEYCEALKRSEGRVRVMPGLRNASNLPKLAAWKPFAVDAAWSALGPDLIQACHGQGIQVYADALGKNERIEEYRKAIGWGIDVIQTDHPLRVLRAIELVSGR